MAIRRRMIWLSQASVNAVAFSPDGRPPASGSDEGTVRPLKVDLRELDFYRGPTPVTPRIGYKAPPSTASTVRNNTLTPFAMS